VIVEGRRGWHLKQHGPTSWTLSVSTGEMVNWKQDVESYQQDVMMTTRTHLSVNYGDFYTHPRWNSVFVVRSAPCPQSQHGVSIFNCTIASIAILGFQQ
jgi:hypothetical protein